MKLVTTSPATIPPVNLVELRTQCRLLDDTSHDVELTQLAQEVTASVEKYLGARIMRQTVRLELPCFPSGRVDLGLYPVESVDAVAYYDVDGVDTTLVSGTDYWADVSGLYPELAPVAYWPATQAGRPGAVRITMTVGWEDPSEVPQDIKGAILQAVGYRFDPSQPRPDNHLLLGPHRRVVL